MSDSPNDSNHINGRRAMDDLELVDTSHKLTYEELTELKKLAQLSKSTRIVFGVIFGVLTVLGIPTIISWFNKHWI
jgi:hypothetical protein